MNPDAATDIYSSWQGANIAFWLLTIFVLISATLATFSHRIVNAAFALFFTLLGMAGYYVLLGSSFLAVTQIIVYVGGILVLLMFGILLTNAPLFTRPRLTSLPYIAAVTMGVLLLGVFTILIVRLPFEVHPLVDEPQSEVAVLGEQLLTTYVFPFEVAGMMLFLCLLGAAYLVRREE
jgi:NADH:ubiquinone oxidoreductase subunit 6 (subunit J)